MAIGGKLHIIHFRDFHQNIPFPVKKMSGKGPSPIPDPSLGGKGTPPTSVPYPSFPPSLRNPPLRNPQNSKQIYVTD